MNNCVPFLKDFFQESENMRSFDDFRFNNLRLSVQLLIATDLKNNQGINQFKFLSPMLIIRQLYFNDGRCLYVLPCK